MAGLPDLANATLAMTAAVLLYAAHNDLKHFQIRNGAHWPLGSALRAARVPVRQLVLS
jgi:hypothetical protein